MRLSRSESHHALHVLRLGVGDEVCVTDGDGVVARCTIAGAEEGRVAGTIVEHRRLPSPLPRVVVYQGAAKAAKTDTVVDRLAQLGASEARVFSSERSIVRWDERKRAALADRWSALAQAAAKQSRSPWLTRTGPALSWQELVDRVAREPRAVVLWEEATRPLRTVLDTVARVALVVGPEGGLSAREAHELERAGAALVSLGARVLRTDNAPVVAASAVLYHYGLIG